MEQMLAGGPLRIFRLTRPGLWLVYFVGDAPGLCLCPMLYLPPYSCKIPIINWLNATYSIQMTCVGLLFLFWIPGGRSSIVLPLGGMIGKLDCDVRY